MHLARGPLSLVAVNVQLELPDQPVDGSLILQPLGGGGFDSPHSVYRLQITLDGAAGGGANLIQVRFDPRYVQIVSALQVSILSGAGAIDVNVIIQDETGIGRAQLRTEIPITTVSGATNIISWTPEPLLVSAGIGVAGDNPEIRCEIPNVDTEDMTMRCSIYNFNKRARELVPIEQMLRFLTRVSAVVK